MYLTLTYIVIYENEKKKITINYLNICEMLLELWK